jgi:hypothetical protein
MATKILLETCELTSQPCRHCSQEIQYRPYTSIVKENGVYKPTGQGRKRCEVGQLCNTQEIGANPWISEMHYCPVAWSVARYGKIPTGKKKLPLEGTIIKAKILPRDSSSK